MEVSTVEGLAQNPNGGNIERQNEAEMNLQGQVGATAVTLFEKLATPNEDDGVINAGVTRVLTRVNGGGTVPDA